MRRSSSFASPLLFAALAGAATAQATHRAMTPEIVAAAQQLVGGDPVAALRTALLPRGDDRRRELPSAKEPAWRAFLVAALWSDDRELAYATTDQLEQWYLDLADMDRWLALAWPHYRDADVHFAWDTFKDILSPAQVHDYLQHPPSWGSDLRGLAIGDLHRTLRPEHIPDLAALLRCDDPLLQRQALEQLYELSCYTRQHRDAIAVALLTFAGVQPLAPEDWDDRGKNPTPVPRTFELPPERPGWSPLLRALLHRQLLELEPQEGRPWFLPMLLRMAEDEQPSEEDRLQILALLDSQHDGAAVLPLRALCRLPRAPVSDERLATPAPGWPQELVLAAQHDFDALRALTDESPQALAAALEFDLTASWTHWLARAFGDDAARGAAAIDNLADARLVQSGTTALVPDAVDALLRQAIQLHGDRLDHDRLHRLVVGFPAARSEHLIDLYLASLRPEHLRDRCAAAELEVSRPVEFAQLLAKWADETDPAAAAAIELLLEMGDCPLAGDRIAAWCRAHDALDPFVIARNAAIPEVMALLDERLRALDTPETSVGEDDLLPLCAAAMAHGLPEATARSWNREFKGRLQVVQARLPHWREQVLAGDPIAALVDFVAAEPPAAVQILDLGLVADERVRAVLRTIRAAPGANVQWAIDELALAGDTAAKRETDEARRRCLYGWLDDAAGYAKCGGRDLALMPWLIGEVETICCRRNGAGSAIRQLTGFDVWATTEYGLRTQREVAQRWWDAVGAQLRWSEIAQRFVVAGF